MTFANWLKTKRAQSGLSCAALGAEVGTSDAQISRLETGVRRPSYEICIALARKLNDSPQKVLKMAGYTVLETVNAG
jgi:transcriptional regulator with XRE-family HTH domain